MMKLKIFLLVATALVAVYADPDADSSSSDDSSEDADLAREAPIPSLLGTFGSKIAIADNIYDEYEDEDDSDQEETVDAPPTPCCFPDVWEGRVWSDYGLTPLGRRRAGRAIAARSLTQVHIDGANKRMAGDILENIGRPAEMDQKKWFNISYIFQIGGNSSADLYLFDRKAEKCRHREMKNVDWTRQCIPKTATYGGKLSLGPGAGGLAVEAWMFSGGSKHADSLVATPDESVDEAASPRPRPRPRPRMRLGASALVLPGSCVPVVIQEEGAVFIADENGENNDVNGFVYYTSYRVVEYGRLVMPRRSFTLYAYYHDCYNCRMMQTNNLCIRFRRYALMHGKAELK